MMKKWLIIILLFMSSLSAKESKPKICLNMIVKDEKEVIERCLGSLKPLIDYWVIFDTGSTDDTQKIIKNFMKDIPGELHERPWVNFAHNRNEALAAAKGKGDYILMVDADEILQFDPGFKWGNLTKDFYFITVRQINSVDAKRTNLIKSALNWRWEGILHEALVCKEAKSKETLSGIINLCNTGSQSGRSKNPDKYARDAAVLERALKDEPLNSRYWFYLAQSYMAAENFPVALKNLEKRAKMESVDSEETFRTLYNIGLCHEKMNHFDEAIKNYFKAYQFRPSRAEPLFRSSVLYRKQGNYLLGYLLSQFALQIPYPKEDGCVEYATYDYAIRIEFANCALLLGRYQEGLDACVRLLSNPHLPKEILPSIEANFELARKNIESSST